MHSTDLDAALSRIRQYAGIYPAERFFRYSSTHTRTQALMSYCVQRRVSRRMS